MVVAHSSAAAQPTSSTRLCTIRHWFATSISWTVSSPVPSSVIRPTTPERCLAPASTPDDQAETVIEARDTETGYELFRNHRPDVGVIDLSMRDDGLGGMSLIRRINAHNRRFPIVVLSMHRDPTIVLQALEAGAVGYVLKDTATEDLLKAVAEVQRGTVI